VQVLEIIIISILATAAVVVVIALTIRNIRGKGTCTTGACSSCSTDTNGCTENDSSSNLNKSDIKRKQ